MFHHIIPYPIKIIDYDIIRWKKTIKLNSVDKYATTIKFERQYFVVFFRETCSIFRFETLATLLVTINNKMFSYAGQSEANRHSFDRTTRECWTVGWLIGFDVGLELRTELPMVWDSPLREVRTILMPV